MVALFLGMLMEVSRKLRRSCLASTSNICKEFTSKINSITHISTSLLSPHLNSPSLIILPSSMESNLITSSSSFSSNPPQIKHHVFLSFRGKDTRNNFTSHLEKALRDKQIKTYIDDQLNSGDQISPSLLKAIEESKISVIVFSEDYASSRWCLEELVKILECKKNYGQIVIPVFYGLDPSVVRHQTGCYANSFAKHVQRFKQSLDKVLRWKDSLKEAADISGFNSLVIKPESELIDHIVYDVLKKLNKMSPSYDKDLVGIRSGIEQIENWLKRGDVRSVGIWGIGGIGKTTLAKAVSRKISCQFDRSYFTGSVRSEKSKDRELNSLRKSLLSTLLEDENAHIGTFMENRLGLMKVLIIFDDVTGFHQIESLIGDLDCLALGSRIIVTSRDKQVLQRLDRLYEVKELPFNYAHELFCRHAFRQNCLDVDYEELSNRVVEKVGGVPLALRVLGCTLLDKEKKVWKSAVEKLENIVDKEIHDVLKISYDELDHFEQNMFLDIACFLNGWDVNLVEMIMDASGFFAPIGMSRLVDKSLIIISNNKVTMHDLLQEVGRNIVLQESINDPGKRTRLFHYKDILHILTKNTGTETIVGISLDMSTTTQDINLHPHAFVKMHKLRFLQFYVSGYCENNRKNKVCIFPGLEYVFNELKYLRWYGYPLKSLQPNFHLGNLVVLEMRKSNIKELWSGVMQFDNLKRLDLGWSQQLIKCPDFSRIPNLESLKLTACTSLPEISSSIIHLTKLESLELDCCKSLTSISDCTGLKSLKHASFIRCSKLKRLPDLPNSLKGRILLNYLTSLVEIPSSVKHLNDVTILHFSGCKSLTSIPDLRGLKSLKELRIRNCWKLKRLTEVPNTIEGLYITNTPIKELPPSSEDLCRLKYLDLTSCSMLKSLPKSVCKWKSLQQLTLLKCSEIDKLPGDIGTLESLKGIEAGGTAIREVPPSISCLRRYSLRSLTFSRYEILSSLISLDNLQSLNLSDSGMTEIPATLSCLTSLRSLILDKNSFGSIPLSIINLSNLESLSISHCNRLKVLPKLPWTSITADCTSLEKLSCLPFQNDTSALRGRIMQANFINCFKLDRNSINVFVENIRRKIQHAAAAFNLGYYKGNQRQLPASICYPESEIPEWFDIQRCGSSINVNLPPHWINCNFLCFSLSAVVAIPEHQHGNSKFRFECKIKSQDGDQNVVRRTGSFFSVSYPGPDYIRSSHVIIGFGFHFLRKICGNELSFQFFVTIDPWSKHPKDCEVEKCGIHFMLAKHLEDGKVWSPFHVSQTS